jgi:hypothetical protein
VASILEAFQTDAFRRVKVGVGQPEVILIVFNMSSVHSTRQAVRHYSRDFGDGSRSVANLLPWSSRFSRASCRYAGQLAKPFARARDALAWRVRGMLGDQRVDGFIEALAKYWRRVLQQPVYIGVTGRGKTTTKLLLRNPRPEGKGMASTTGPRTSPNHPALALTTVSASAS